MDLLSTKLSNCGITERTSLYVGAVEYRNLTTTQRDGLTPIEGETIYNTTVKALQVYNGTEWVGSSSPSDAYSFCHMTKKLDPFLLPLVSMLFSSHSFE